jgi:hypothetical protein
MVRAETALFEPHVQTGQTIVLPRQARDRRRKNLRKDAFPCRGLNVDYNAGWLRQEVNQYLDVPPEVAKTPPFCAILQQKSSFYQDRLGTNIGKVEKRDRRFQIGGENPAS